MSRGYRRLRLTWIGAPDADAHAFTHRSDGAISDHSLCGLWREFGWKALPGAEHCKPCHQAAERNRR